MAAVLMFAREVDESGRYRWLRHVSQITSSCDESWKVTEERVLVSCGEARAGDRRVDVILGQ